MPGMAVSGIVFQVDWLDVVVIVTSIPADRPVLPNKYLLLFLFGGVRLRFTSNT